MERLHLSPRTVTASTDKMPSILKIVICDQTRSPVRPSHNTLLCSDSRPGILTATAFSTTRQSNARLQVSWPNCCLSSPQKMKNYLPKQIKDRILKWDYANTGTAVKADGLKWPTLVMVRLASFLRLRLTVRTAVRRCRGKCQERRKKKECHRRSMCCDQRRLAEPRNTLENTQAASQVFTMLCKHRQTLRCSFWACLRHQVLTHMATDWA